MYVYLMYNYSSTMNVCVFRLCLELHSHFPYDVGCLTPFFLTCILLRPGDCLYIPPNVLHAYLEGQLVECMACSDNVIRYGD